METKLGLMLAGQKGLMILETLLNSKNINSIGIVVSFKEANMRESYYNSIEEKCNSNNIPFYSWSEIKEDLPKITIKHNLTEIVVIGWKYKIDLSINRYLRNGVIIFHDSLLPRYRGFAPTPTAIICGEQIIGTSVFSATEEIDAGEIILQEELFVPEDIYIDEIIYQQGLLYSKLMIKLLALLKEPCINSYPQEEELATYSIWRSPEDCKIDWCKSSKQIYNLIRAISFPYPGAYTYIGNKKIYIWKSVIMPDKKFEIRQEGKVWEIDNDGNPIVICGEGMLKLTDITDEKMERVIINNIRTRFS